MKTLTVRTAQFSILWICAFFAGGCATGPRYLNSQQPDSANVESFRTPWQRPEDGSCGITITNIDGLWANFDASLPGPNWPLSPKRLFLSPGTHMLGLDISEIDISVLENYSDGGSLKSVITAENRSVVTIAVEAKHSYRFTADLAGQYIELTLWDETTGAGSRTNVQHWSLDSHRTHTEEHDEPSP